MKRWLIYLIASFMLFEGPAQANPFQDAVTAYDIGDFTQAARLLNPLAEKGDSAAQHFLGQLYEQGRGLNQNYQEAMRWYRLSAIQGNPKAQYNLGRMYETGSGVAPDYVRAHMWYGLASVHGFKVAESYRTYIAQRMTPDQIAKAERLMRECANGDYSNCD